MMRPEAMRAIHAAIQNLQRIQQIARQTGSWYAERLASDALAGLDAVGFPSATRAAPEPQPQSSGAVDEESFAEQIRENLSPDGVATVIAFLQPAAFQKTDWAPDPARSAGALREAEWLHDTLVDLLGAGECNSLLNQLGL